MICVPDMTWEEKVRRSEFEGELVAHEIARAQGQLNDPTNLLSQPVVEQICKDFLHELYGYLCTYDKSQERFETGIEKICVKYAEIFSGKNPAYTPDKLWTGERLARFIMEYGVARPRGEGIEPSNPVGVLRLYFLEMANRYLRKVTEEVEKKITFEEYKEILEPYFEGMVGELRGIPNFRVLYPPREYEGP